jgi:hypothetical protein
MSKLYTPRIDNTENKREAIRAAIWAAIIIVVIILGMHFFA